MKKVEKFDADFFKEAAGLSILFNAESILTKIVIFYKKNFLQSITSNRPRAVIICAVNQLVSIGTITEYIALSTQLKFELPTLTETAVIDFLNLMNSHLGFNIIKCCFEVMKKNPELEKYCLELSGISLNKFFDSAISKLEIFIKKYFSVIEKFLLKTGKFPIELFTDSPDISNSDRIFKLFIYIFKNSINAKIVTEENIKAYLEKILSKGDGTLEEIICDAYQELEKNSGKPRIYNELDHLVKYEIISKEQANQYRLQLMKEQKKESGRAKIELAIESTNESQEVEFSIPLDKLKWRLTPQGKDFYDKDTCPKWLKPASEENVFIERKAPLIYSYPGFDQKISNASPNKKQNNLNTKKEEVKKEKSTKKKIEKETKNDKTTEENKKENANLKIFSTNLKNDAEDAAKEQKAKEEKEREAKIKSEIEEQNKQAWFKKQEVKSKVNKSKQKFKQKKKGDKTPSSSFFYSPSSAGTEEKTHSDSKVSTPLPPSFTHNALIPLKSKKDELDVINRQKGKERQLPLQLKNVEEILIALTAIVEEKSSNAIDAVIGALILCFNYLFEFCAENKRFELKATNFIDPNDIKNIRNFLVHKSLTIDESVIEFANIFLMFQIRIESFKANGKFLHQSEIPLAKTKFYQLMQKSSKEIPKDDVTYLKILITTLGKLEHSMKSIDSIEILMRPISNAFVVISFLFKMNNITKLFSANFKKTYPHLIDLTPVYRNQIAHPTTEPPSDIYKYDKLFVGNKTINYPKIFYIGFKANVLKEIAEEISIEIQPPTEKNLSIQTKPATQQNVPVKTYNFFQANPYLTMPNYYPTNDYNSFYQPANDNMSYYGVNYYVDYTAYVAALKPILTLLTYINDKNFLTLGTAICEKIIQLDPLLMETVSYYLSDNIGVWMKQLPYLIFDEKVKNEGAKYIYCNAATFKYAFQSALDQIENLNNQISYDMP